MNRNHDHRTPSALLAGAAVMATGLLGLPASAQDDMPESIVLSGTVRDFRDRSSEGVDGIGDGVVAGVLRQCVSRCKAFKGGAEHYRVEGVLSHGGSTVRNQWVKAIPKGEGGVDVEGNEISCEDS